MTRPVSIRPAASGDVDRVAEIMREAGWQDKAAQRPYSGFTDRDHVAEGDHGRVVGYFTMDFDCTLKGGSAPPGPHTSLGVILVAAQYRRQGIGRTILRWCAEEAARRGRAYVWLQVDLMHGGDGDIDGRVSFFEHCGLLVLDNNTLQMGAPVQEILEATG